MGPNQTYKEIRIKTEVHYLDWERVANYAGEEGYLYMIILADPPWDLRVRLEIFQNERKAVKLNFR